VASYTISKIIAILTIVAMFIALVMVTVSSKQPTISSPTSSSTPPTSPPTSTSLITIPTTVGFSIFKTGGVEVNVPQGNSPQYVLPLDLGSIANFKDVSEKLSLSSEAVEKLRINGFVVVDSFFNDISDIYTRINDLGIPTYISTDSVLFIYHTFFNQLLIDLEENRFYPLLKILLKSLIDEDLKIIDSLSPKSLAREAAEKDLAYLSVAYKLLNPNYIAPKQVSEIVDMELELIGRAEDTEAKSPIFTYIEDYTQYKPRGHYTVNDTLRSYFKAMMWLGRMRFEAYDPFNPEIAKIQTAQALILTYIILTAKTPEETALSMWEKIYVPTAFIVGRSDDLTIYDYIEKIVEIYGLSFNPNMVNDEEKLSRFQSEVVKLDRSRIVNTPWYPNERRRMAGLRFMGQRFIIDGYIHQSLCYPNIYRFMVKGMDVMAALGSGRAEKHLEDEKIKYKGYSEKLEEMKRFVESLTGEEWTETLYMGWLYTIRAELNQAPEGYPNYMRTEAWLDKSLNTALASWAQLRHDTILYAKQPYAAKVSLPLKPPHYGYVEPNPQLYSRLKNLVDTTLNGLKKLNLTSNVYEEKLGKLSEILKLLINISVKELSGERLNRDEEYLIESYHSQVRILTGEIIGRVRDSRIIADVFTDPNSNMVLEVGTGYFNIVIVAYIAENNKTYLAAGSAMSYYEFTWPQGNRLTDEAWREMLENREAPPQPEWTFSFKPHLS
jgi:hypothetical protein